MAPDRRLDLDLPALVRLADVPGFGEAWEKLPPFAPARLEQLALEADLDLIYAEDRSTECFLKANEYQEYNFYSGDAARGYEDRWLAGILRNQLALNQRCVKNMHKYIVLWETTDIRKREEIFIAARTAHAKDRGDRTYLLHCPELRMDKLCGGNGHGFLHLLFDLTWNKDDVCEKRDGIPTAPKRLKQAQWDRWFGFDEAAGDQLPLPVAIRGFAINAMVFRMGLLIGTSSMMLEILEAGCVVKPYLQKVAEINHREDAEAMYESRRVAAPRDVDSNAGARSMVTTYEDHLASMARWDTNEAVACDFCAHVETAEHGKLLWCGPCKKQGRWVRYCSALCQKNDWNFQHRPVCGKPCPPELQKSNQRHRWSRSRPVRPGALPSEPFPKPCFRCHEALEG